MLTTQRHFEERAAALEESVRELTIQLQQARLLATSRHEELDSVRSELSMAKDQIRSLKAKEAALEEQLASVGTQLHQARREVRKGGEAEVREAEQAVREHERAIHEAAEAKRSAEQAKAEERRTNPEDGQSYTLPELRARYADEYDPQQVLDYWEQECYQAEEECVHEGEPLLASG